MATVKNDNPRYAAKEIKKMPGYQRRLFSRASADFDLLVDRLRRESLAWPGRTQRLRKDRARAVAAILLGMLQTANLATGYVHMTMTELASRCGLRTKGKAGYHAHGRASRSIAQLCAQAGFIEYTSPTFNPLRHARDPSLIVVRREFFWFMGAKPDELEKEQAHALRRLLTARKRASEAGKGVPAAELELPESLGEACCKLRLEQWASYTKTKADRAQRALNRLRHAHASRFKTRVDSLYTMMSAFARLISPHARKTADRVREARQGLLFDVGNSPPDDPYGDGIPY